MSVDHHAFASDNVAGICPESWAVFSEANTSCVGSYGEDPFTEEACQHLRRLFEREDIEIFFVFSGTAANSLALSALCRSYHAIVAHEKAHIVTDECGGPEHFTGGSKILPCSGEHAKLVPKAVDRAVSQRRDLHFPKPRALSFTQATEFGTVYSLEEARALTVCARSHGLHVHLDGARITNALAHLDVSPAEMTWKSGVDVMSFGLTKLGTGMGEAVIFFNRDLAEDFDYRCKQAGQLASKMRFLSSAWCGLLREDAWKTIATSINAKAKRLRQGLAEIDDVELLFPTEANAVFARFTDKVNEGMQTRGWHYYELAGVGDSRLMCSWATSDADIDAFVSDVQELS